MRLGTDSAYGGVCAFSAGFSRKSFGYRGAGHDGMIFFFASPLILCYTVRIPSTKGCDAVSQKRPPLVRIALLCALLGLLCLLPCIIPYQGQLVYYGDYLRQYVPFLLETKRMLWSGSLAWSWNTFLGDGFYGAYSYYTAVNPFAWLAMLFPNSLILYGALAAQLVKFALSGVCCALYLRCFIRNDTVLAIGAVLYAFSGFTIVNNNYYFFLDVIAVFPLLLLGMERVAARRDMPSVLLLAFAVFLNAEINYYFFISSAVLCLIYGIFRFEWYRLPAGGLRLLLRLTASVLLGCGMAGFVLLPSFWKILHTPKATGSLGGVSLRPYSLENILERLRIFFMPIENNIQHAFYRSGSWTSTAVYLAVFGGAFALLFVLRNRRHWLTKTMVTLLVFLLIPVLNSVFTLFSDYSYTRWLYGFVLLLDLATALVLEQRRSIPRAQLRRSFRIAMAITVVLAVPPALVCLLAYFGVSTPLSALYTVAQSTIYAGLKGVAIALALTLVNDVLLFLVLLGRAALRRTLVFVCVASVVNYGGYLLFYNYINADRLQTIQTERKSLAVSDADTYSYRMDSSATDQNVSLLCNTPSVSGYHSLQNQNAVSFAVAAGYTDTNTTIVLDRPDTDSGTLDTLLSVRYYTDTGTDSEAQIPEGFALISDENGVKTYENQNFLPFGFCYDGYITQQQAEESPLSKTQLMLSALVVDGEEAFAVSQLLPQADIADFSLTDAANARRTQCTDSFAGTSSGFTASITLDRANYVFFSVPNDEGWQASVNGHSADILTVNYGLCAVRCDAGTNTIVFTYHTPWLVYGCVLTLLSLALTAGLWMLAARRRHSNRIQKGTP